MKKVTIWQYFEEDYRTLDLLIEVQTGEDSDKGWLTISVSDQDIIRYLEDVHGFKLGEYDLLENEYMKRKDDIHKFLVEKALTSNFKGYTIFNRTFYLKSVFGVGKPFEL